MVDDPDVIRVELEQATLALEATSAELEATSAELALVYGELALARAHLVRYTWSRRAVRSVILAGFVIGVGALALALSGCPILR